MDNLIFASIGFLFLLSIVYFIPLGVSMKGKVILLLASWFVTIVSLLSVPVFQWWYSVLLMVTLSGLLTILLQRMIQSSRLKKEANEEINIMNTANEEVRTTSLFQTGKHENNLDDVDFVKEHRNKEEDPPEYEEIQETHSYVRENVKPDIRIDNEIDDEQDDVKQFVPLVNEEEEILSDRGEDVQEDKLSLKAAEGAKEEPANIADLSPEEELLAARQQISDEPKQDRELNNGPFSPLSDLDSEDFVIDEFKQEDLEKQNIKKKFEDREGFETFEVDMIEEQDLPTHNSDHDKEDRTEFTDLEDLLNQRDD